MLSIQRGINLLVRYMFAIIKDTVASTTLEIYYVWHRQLRLGAHVTFGAQWALNPTHFIWLEILYFIII